MRIVSTFGVILVVGLLSWFVLTNEGPDARYPVKLGLDLAGGTSLVYKADTKDITSDKQGALNSLRDVVDKRVNLFGVAEPLVQLERSSAVAGTQEDRLIIELPGVTDVKAAVDAIGKTPTLEFKLVGEAEGTYVTTGLTGRYVKSAELQFGQGGATPQNEPIVVLHFNDDGAKLFSDITSQNIGKQLAIFLDGQPISTPVIREAIVGGTATISGQFTPTEARELVQNLNFGALPVPITLVSSDTVGSTLGDGAYQAGLVASLVGFILVAIFMIAWYRLPGLIATIALIIYLLITIALIKVIPITLTASGIAALILSIGMAVDANVLIFERLKEELRAGKDPREAVRLGFGRAWPAIRDGHFTMLISSVILFWMGTSLVQGFALVFGLGVLASLVTAVGITRVFLLAVVPEKTSHVWHWLLECGRGSKTPNKK